MANCSSEAVELVKKEISLKKKLVPILTKTLAPTTIKHKNGSAHQLENIIKIIKIIGKT